MQHYHVPVICYRHKYPKELVSSGTMQVQRQARDTLEVETVETYFCWAASGKNMEKGAKMPSDLPLGLGLLSGVSV